MGFKNLFTFTALLLVWKVCRVYGQAARVEYINQPYTSSVATAVQATPQIVVPAIYKPVVLPYDSCIQESVPTIPSNNGFNGYSNYVPSYPQPMPLIIIEDDDDDNWHHILYYLLFAMRNKRNGDSGNFGSCSGGQNGGCGCGGGCNSGYGGYNGGYNGGCGGGDHYGGGSSYIPYPTPYPMSGPYPYSFPGFGDFPDNSGGYREEPYQPGQGTNDINLYIRTDSS